MWLPVCEALYKKDWNGATREKQRIEQDQREKADARKKNGESCVINFLRNFRIEIAHVLFQSSSYVPRFFEPEPEDLSKWDGRPILSAAGREALERDFKADYTS